VHRGDEKECQNIIRGEEPKDDLKPSSEPLSTYPARTSKAKWWNWSGKGNKSSAKMDGKAQPKL